MFPWFPDAFRRPTMRTLLIAALLTVLTFAVFGLASLIDAVSVFRAAFAFVALLIIGRGALRATRGSSIGPPRD